MDLHDAFTRIDADNDGVVTVEELNSTLKKLEQMDRKNRIESHSDHLSNDKREQEEEEGGDRDREATEKLPDSEIRVTMRDIRHVLSVINIEELGHGGAIDYKEFVSTGIARSQYLKEEAMAAAFQRFDTAGDGVISKEDLRLVLQEAEGREVTDSEVDDVMALHDSNGDGVIDYHEFVDMMFQGEGSLSMQMDAKVSDTALREALKEKD